MKERGEESWRVRQKFMCLSDVYSAWLGCHGAARRPLTFFPGRAGPGLEPWHRDQVTFHRHSADSAQCTAAPNALAVEGALNSFCSDGRGRITINMERVNVSFGKVHCSERAGLGQGIADTVSMLAEGYRYPVPLIERHNVLETSQCCAGFTAPRKVGS